MPRRLSTLSFLQFESYAKSILEGQPPSSAGDTPFDAKGAGDEQAPFDMKGGQSPTAASGRGREGDVVKREVSANEVRREPAVQTGGAERRGLFPDVPASAWYFDAVTWAAVNGLIEGHNGRFDPNRAITRQEMAVMLGNYANFKG